MVSMAKSRCAAWDKFVCLFVCVFFLGSGGFYSGVPADNGPANKCIEASVLHSVRERGICFLMTAFTLCLTF